MSWFGACKTRETIITTALPKATGTFVEREPGEYASKAAIQDIKVWVPSIDGSVYHRGVFGTSSLLNTYEIDQLCAKATGGDVMISAREFDAIIPTVLPDQRGAAKEVRSRIIENATWNARGPARSQAGQQIMSRKSSVKQMRATWESQQPILAAIAAAFPDDKELAQNCSQPYP